MLEDLLKEGKINKEQYDMYVVFALDEKGAKWLKDKSKEFMRNEIMPNSDLCIYAEGKRAVLKEIYVAIDEVEAQIERRNNGYE